MLLLGYLVLNTYGFMAFVDIKTKAEQMSYRMQMKECTPIDIKSSAGSHKQKRTRMTDAVLSCCCCIFIPASHAQLDLTGYRFHLSKSHSVPSPSLQILTTTNFSHPPTFPLLPTVSTLHLFPHPLILSLTPSGLFCAQQLQRRSVSLRRAKQLKD